MRTAYAHHRAWLKASGELPRCFNPFLSFFFFPLFTILYLVAPLPESGPSHCWAKKKKRKKEEKSKKKVRQGHGYVSIGWPLDAECFKSSINVSIASITPRIKYSSPLRPGVKSRATHPLLLWRSAHCQPWIPITLGSNDSRPNHYQLSIEHCVWLISGLFFFCNGRQPEVGPRKRNAQLHDDCGTWVVVLESSLDLHGRTSK